MKQQHTGQRILTTFQPLFRIRQSLSLKYFVSLFVFSAMLLPATGLGLYSYVTLQRNLTRELEAYLQQKNTFLQETTKTRFQIIEEKSLQLLSHPFVQTTLEKPNDVIERNLVSFKIRMDKELQNLFMFNYAWENKLFNSVFIYKDDTLFFHILRDYMYHKVIRAFHDIYLRSQEMSRQFELYPPIDDTTNIYLVRNINRIGTLLNLGKLIISINVEEIPLLDHQNIQYPGTQVLIYDQNGMILIHTDPKSVGQPIPFPATLLQEDTNYAEIVYQDQPYIVSTADIGVFDLRLLILIPKSQAFSQLHRVTRQYLIICAVLLLLSLLIGTLISNIAATAIRKMTTTIEQVKDGNFEARMPSFAPQELQQLRYGFDTMTERFDFLINEVYEKQLLLKETELKSLQAQINPHFLFNVLETISWHARIAKNEGIYEMITTLGKLLRANLALSKTEHITIRQELELVEFYASLQKARFPDRLNVSIQVEQEVLKERQIPKLIIQPLVENAIEHGLQHKRGTWDVLVSISRRPHHLYICVKDNGIGFDTTQINIDDHRTLEIREKGHTRIGLANIRKRIQLLYGDDQEVIIHSTPGKGTEVSIMIPLKMEQEC